MWWHQEKWLNKHQSWNLQSHIHSWWYKRQSIWDINTTCFWTSLYNFFGKSLGNIVSCILISQLNEFNSCIWRFIWIRKHFIKQSTYRWKSWFTYELICWSKNNRKYDYGAKTTSSWLISIWLEESICKTQRSKE